MQFYVSQDALALQFLMRMFFTLFTKLMDLDDTATECSKILSQILRGINKALPFTKVCQICIYGIELEGPRYLHRQREQPIQSSAKD